MGRGKRKVGVNAEKGEERGCGEEEEEEEMSITVVPQ